ncbi:YfaP family protein [Paraburkholderia kirstenboschensis]|uniref:Uncharacterized protein n=1 Tax=Paraburkholderia kirstenboschensis TaxID=1245436 RepID=A0ABZ0EHL8_9BURK|nr:hypothetical protein [Paraburkholderia kirstenboschensis]WOD16720.1 hypothetical protein RW095_12640 [Paraburkholderia kirstenboschensis]
MNHVTFLFSLSRLSLLRRVRPRAVLLVAVAACGAFGAGIATQARAAGTDGGVADLTCSFGGWRHSGLTNEGEQFVAAYPRSPVDRGAQRYRTLIEGRLKRIDKHARKPPTLVVNGNPTPLYTDDEGAFARPWAFGAGSNSIELISADGRQHQRMQFYEADRSKPQAKLRAIVTWDDPHAQVDLHVITPGGLHAFFANPTLEDGSGFDVDSVDGAGPGIFSSAAPERGTWLFFLNYWGCGYFLGLNYAAIPRLFRYSTGLRKPSESLIRFALYQRMYESTVSMN